MEGLKYRRQFLLTPVEFKKFATWQTEKAGNHFIYVHPDCLFEKSSGIHSLYLVGYFLDPHNPQKSAKNILDSLSQEKNIDNFPKKLYGLVGRFVLIIKLENDFIFFNDTCGLKTLYYTKNENGIYAASQPLLLNEVLELKKKSTYNEYFNSAYVAKTIEHWLPSGFSLFENVYHLIPNHYLKASAYKQKRYYPSQKLKKKNYDELLTNFSDLLLQIILSAHKHLDLAFTLTAGWDSRVLLSCCKDISKEVFFYTLRYRNMDDKHMDIKVPLALSSSLNLNFEIIDCEEEATTDFLEIYQQNTDLAHINDWGKIAYGMLENYPQGKFSVKGNCSEIGRCFYYPTGKHKKNVTVEDLLYFEKGWNKLSFIREEIEKWFASAKEAESRFKYDLYDLFYWEHRMGSWQAQSQLEWDIAQEAFSPFNSRELLDLLLSVDSAKRIADNPVFYQDVINILWKETLSEPINPLSLKKKAKKIIAFFIKKVISNQ